MDFINKGLSSILNLMFYGVIFLLVIYLLFNIVPLIFVALVVTWAVIKGIKKIKIWSSRRKGESKVGDSIEIIKNVTPEDFADREIIDVDYREVR